MVTLPFSVGGTPGARDLFGLFDDTLSRLLAGTAEATVMNEAYTSLSILWPALVAGLIVVLSHVPLGRQVLSRGIVFIDLAIAQVAGLGVIAAQSAGLDLHGWQDAGRRRRGGAARRVAADVDRAQASRRCRKR